MFSLLKNNRRVINCHRGLNEIHVNDSYIPLRTWIQRRWISVTKIVLCKRSCQTIKWAINDTMKTFITLNFQFNNACFKEFNLIYVNAFLLYHPLLCLIHVYSVIIILNTTRGGNIGLQPVQVHTHSLWQTEYMCCSGKYYVLIPLSWKAFLFELSHVPHWKFQFSHMPQNHIATNHAPHAGQSTLIIKIKWTLYMYIHCIEMDKYC